VKDDDSIDEGDIFSFDIQVNNYTTSAPRENTKVHWYVNYPNSDSPGYTIGVTLGTPDGEAPNNTLDLSWLGGGGSSSTTNNIGYADVEYQGDTNNGLAKGPSYRVTLDQKTEGPELLTVEIRKNVNSGILATKTFTINDTSKNGNGGGNTSEPVEFPIGWYGAVLDRNPNSQYSEEDDVGASYWISRASNSSASNIAERFLDEAENNYEEGDEDIYNENALNPSDVSEKDVITGTASYDPDTGKTTITGTRLDGSTINKTIEGKVSQTNMNFK